VIEVLYKKIILIILNLSIIYSIDNKSNIVNSILPIELSQNSFGIHVLYSNDFNSKTYFDHQSWLTENLVINNYISPSLDNSINISYGINLGYSTILEKKYLKNMIYIFGYHKHKYSIDKFKLSNFSIKPMIKINNQSWVSISIDYLFNNKESSEKKYFTFNYMQLLKKDYIVNFGFQFQKDDSKSYINYFIGLNYSL
tara:strand:+ start:139 stop:732 length:594 start_codon:yes stop_codon:yes gene_type:complete